MNLVIKDSMIWKKNCRDHKGCSLNHQAQTKQTAPASFNVTGKIQANEMSPGNKMQDCSNFRRKTLVLLARELGFHVHQGLLSVVKVVTGHRGVIENS